ncbi:MAG: STAS domain-containing protein [Nostocaceae cyanobacterium]|nr:STAS domain-containing protein [Nostocaceae cyanobacterium]
MNPVVKVVQPQGNFESSKVQEFRQHIEDLLASGVEVVLVDLRDVSFMDSSGLGGLVLALKTTTAAGCKLCLCSINEQVRLLFELTGMMDIFEIFSNQDEFHKFVST